MGGIGEGKREEAGQYIYLNGEWVNEREFKPVERTAPAINIKEYQHYNRTMGKYIRSKTHYEEELARGGYVSQDKMDAATESNRQRMENNYKASDELRELTTEVAQTADKKGNIKPGDRAKDKFREMTKMTKKAPTGLGLEGGIADAV